MQTDASMLDDGAATAPVDRFVEEMDHHWVQDLGNKSNKKFREVWRRMAATYNAAIIESMKRTPLNISPGWFVLAPEMGTGKTVGACLYLGLLARDLQTVKPPLRIG